ncbi:MAG: Asp-tRNA(Asn)/Glu-tRNA(Gln) amidotransferase subunit GatC [Planctomycetes bacterium]|nr:Asp-tRNA(Asn)/Glu-tRNA(Gln) amidotransferase subunit GatC [Planctomycetota bacterium]
MQVDSALVHHVADLARLGLTPEDQERYIAEMGRILGYVEKLNELNVDGVEPLVHPFDARNVFRSDEVRPCPDREEALANAPDRSEMFFRVPKVIE